MTDIPDLVQEDVCDLGLVGLNVLEEKRLELRERGQAARFQQIRTLDFGRCRLSLAVPEVASFEGAAPFAASASPRHTISLQKTCESGDITADIVRNRVCGSVESARLGHALAIPAVSPREHLAHQTQVADVFLYQVWNIVIRTNNTSRGMFSP